MFVFFYYFHPLAEMVYSNGDLKQYTLHFGYQIVISRPYVYRSSMANCEEWEQAPLAPQNGEARDLVAVLGLIPAGADLRRMKDSVIKNHLVHSRGK